MTFVPKDLLKSVYVEAVTRWRECSPKGREIARKRAATDALLDGLARSTPSRFEGTVLVDGMWDNPNYWLRYALLRGALGLAHGREVGIVGEFKHRQCRDTFSALGIATVESFPDLPVRDDAVGQAAKLVSETRSAEDILGWTLPDGVHPTIIYDGILKRQRLAAVDIHHPLFQSHVAEGLRSIERSRYLLDTYKPALVALSHPFNFSYGTLAWQALSRGIPVVILWAIFGTLRFSRLSSLEDLFRFYDRPTGKEMDALPPQQADALAAVGRDYLSGRFLGRADDLQAIYAYSRANRVIDRAKLCEKFGWDSSKPIVGFYASNWYDWPHQLGMTQFRDFLDWTRASVTVACANDRVNWLFKPHPCEDWFGGIALADILADVGAFPHVAVSDKSWSNTEVMHSIDALVTYHGTAGIEFASMGKPVLIPDRGKYDDCGFAKATYTRDQYLNMLATDWWSDIDLNETRRRAEIFAGWWFCAPDWQDGFVLRDDARQDELYDVIPGMVSGAAPVVAKELDTLRSWWASGHPYYHTFKMRQGAAYRMSNIGQA